MRTLPETCAGAHKGSRRARRTTAPSSPHAPSPGARSPSRGAEYDHARASAGISFRGRFHARTHAEHAQWHVRALQGKNAGRQPHSGQRSAPARSPGPNVPPLASRARRTRGRGASSSIPNPIAKTKTSRVRTARPPYAGLRRPRLRPGLRTATSPRPPSPRAAFP